VDRWNFITLGSLQGRPQSLDNISFAIEPGETVAVVGHTGAGKNHPHQPAVRFYEVQEGSITFDGIDIRELRLGRFTPEFWHRTTRSFLFSGR